MRIAAPTPPTTVQWVCVRCGGSTGLPWRGLRPWLLFLYLVLDTQRFCFGILLVFCQGSVCFNDTHITQ